MPKNYVCKAGRFVIKSLAKASSYISKEVTNIWSQEDRLKAELKEEPSTYYYPKKFARQVEPKLNKLFSDGTKLCYLSEKTGCKKSIDEKIIGHVNITQETSFLLDAFKIDYKIKDDGSISFEPSYKN